MYLFKTSGQTFDSVIKNQKHAFKIRPKDWSIGEIILVSKNKKDCKENEKQIKYMMKFSAVRDTSDAEIERYWPGNKGRWKFIVDCTDTKLIEEPFDLEDVLEKEDVEKYLPVMTFKKIQPIHESLILKYLQYPSLTLNNTDEITNPQSYIEGASQVIHINSYERDKNARKACIKHHGLSCKVCGFNFENKYGDLGAGFIHVHHIMPLSDIKKSYKVDPIKHLIPLCANCHSIIHRKKPALSMQELSDYLKKVKRDE